MHKLGVMRCSPLGIVAVDFGHGEFQSGRRISRSRARPAVFPRPAPRRPTRSASPTTTSRSAGRSACSSWARRTATWTASCRSPACARFPSRPIPTLASRPFDAARDGFVGTGGAAVLVLESEEEVARRGVKPYCEVAGWGQASDGHNVAISHPEGTGLRRGDGERACKVSGITARRSTTSTPTPPPR